MVDEQTRWIEEGAERWVTVRWGQENGPNGNGRTPGIGNRENDNRAKTGDREAG